MLNYNNNRSLHSPKAAAKSAYSITDRLHSKHYLAKMATVRRAAGPHTRIHDQTTVLASKPTPAPSLKQRFDCFAKALFSRLDFQSGGFVSASKISREKGFSEAEFYFFGGVFQKVKQMGAVTERLFLSLCDELYLHASQKDIKELLAGGTCLSGNATLKKKTGKKKGGRSIKSCTSLKHSKSTSKMEYLPPADRTPLKQSKMGNATLPKKESLKRYLQSAERLKSKRHRQVTRSIYDHQQEEEDRELLADTRRMCEYSNHFDSLRVRQLSERLDRQILQSQTRISLNQYLR